ncbi:hypothetical protein ACIBG8_54630 [Nonomuraea sp. NPDC050556]|uniref:hypothetical protein n=1 Tax=Nonomuraea sp. NPDC050556 TaxID=3364369 RepID=UPI0037B68929
MDDRYAQVTGTLTRVSGSAPADAWWNDVAAAMATALGQARRASDPDGSGTAGLVSGDGSVMVLPPDADAEGGPDPAAASRPFEAGALISQITTPGQGGVNYARYVPGLVAVVWEGLSFASGGASWKVTVDGVQAGVYGWPVPVDPGEGA